jgi:hypothetical protein
MRKIFLYILIIFVFTGTIINVAGATELPPPEADSGEDAGTVTDPGYSGETIPDSNDPVIFDPQKGNGEKVDEVYKLLAPIPGLEFAPTNIGEYFNTIFNIAIGICAVLAVIMMIIGGVQYMGVESIFGKTKAKEQITSAIFGLLIALGAFALLNTINPALLGGGGVTIEQVSAEIDEELVPWTEYQSGDNVTGCPEGFVDVVVTGTTPNKINVCKSISTNLTNMITAAKTNTPSLKLSGSGSRSMARQQQLREQNQCADPKLPSNACHPVQVARPGMSNHEKGLAVDFNCNGTGISKTDTNNVCYKWLVNNASQYGFKNNYSLLKETWHWSTTGT